MTDDILMLFGKDFGYKQPHRNFFALDSLIKYMNEKHGDKYLFKYSTPSKYLEAI